MIEIDNLINIRDFIRYGITLANQHKIFLGHGTDEVSDEIIELVLGSLNLSHNNINFILDSRLTTAEIAKLKSNLYKRIIEKIPTPYLTKRAYFCDLEFYIDNRALIPRSPIGELIKNQFSPFITVEKVHNILDLCTGSGCIGLACAIYFDDANIDCADLSKEALMVAKFNAAKLQLNHVQLIESNCFENIPPKQYDIIVSNPPYVGEDEFNCLAAEYYHEPKMALLCENNGLEIVINILNNAYNYLSDDGILIVEVGNSQDELVKLYPELGFTWLDFEHGGDGVFLLTKDELAKLKG